MPKITFIGAGSSVFAKNLWGDILNYPELTGATISLFVIDETLDTPKTAQQLPRSLAAAPPLFTEAAQLSKKGINQCLIKSHPSTRLTTLTAVTIR